MRNWPAVLTLVLLGFLCVAGTAPDAHAQYFGQNKVQYDEFDFQTLETEHFVFYFYPAEERAVRDAARMAERWYDRHTQIFLHQFDEKKPVILYANDADFQQTNVTNQPLGPGTGGFTEPARERVVMPLSASYGETSHVLGHELVHSFQYDLALNGETPIQLQRLPLWLIEGTAEYLSLGRTDPHTAMWMRDAVLHDNMPTFGELANPREYFPYRFGQAYMAYIGGKYGDQSVTDLYKVGGRARLDSAYTQLFGVSADSLTREWADATESAYEPLMENRTHPDSLGKTVLSEEKNGGRVNIAPTLSPDGRYVAFISERELFQFKLFVADAETGEVIADLQSAGTTSHFNALRFINSAGTWSPNGNRLAFISFADGDNQLTLWNVRNEKIERSFQVKGVTSMKNPTWSPDGSKIVFTGTDGGISDLYVLELESGNVRQLTNDRYADMQPTWSPSGDRIAFTTDRAETDLNLLDVSTNYDIGIIDVESGDITMHEPFGNALHHNPQFDPSGRELYLISDQDGFKDIYRYNLDTKDVRRVTRLKTGISGITATSPAMSVALEAGDVMAAVYSDNRYTCVRLSDEKIDGQPLAQGPQGVVPSTAIGDSMRTAEADSMRTPQADSVASRSDTGRVDSMMTAQRDAAQTDTTQTDTTQGDAALLAQYRNAPKDTTRAGVLPPYEGEDDKGLVATALSDSKTGLPPSSEDFSEDEYDGSLTLEGIAPPQVGASIGGPFGGGVAGGVALKFSDMLGNKTLITALRANGTFRDIGGAVAYQNRGQQLNYGGSLSHNPIIYDFQSVPLGFGRGAQVIRRIQLTSASVGASYPFDTTRRIEFGVGGQRYGYGVQIREFGAGRDYTVESLNDAARDVYDIDQDIIREEQDTQYLANTSVAYVRDFTTQGLTGPLAGGRWRFEVQPNVGSENFVTARADVRRYFYAKPLTFAFQGLHVGNYGAGDVAREFGVGAIGNEYIGYPYGQGFVRGYNVRDIGGNECSVPDANTTTRLVGCPEIDRLFGTRAVTLRAEARLPLFGPERLAVLPFQYLPTTLVAFGDAGVAWTGDQAPDLTFERSSSATNIPVYSVGGALRFNVLGRLILETYYAKPFQRPQQNWEWGLRLTPGW